MSLDALSWQTGITCITPNEIRIRGYRLTELGFPTEVASLVFAIGRVPGLATHVYEERTRQRPMRAIDFTQAEYDGPAERVLPVHV